jgi:hypothetical protein
MGDSAPFAWTVVLVLVIAMIVEVCGEHPPTPDVRVPARITVIDYDKVTMPTGNPRAPLTQLRSAIHVVQLDTHIYAHATERQLRGLRLWQCVWVRWNTDRLQWDYESPAVPAACLD